MFIINNQVKKHDSNSIFNLLIFFKIPISKFIFRFSCSVFRKVSTVVMLVFILEISTNPLLKKCERNLRNLNIVLLVILLSLSFALAIIVSEVHKFELNQIYSPLDGEMRFIAAFKTIRVFYQLQLL